LRKKRLTVELKAVAEELDEEDFDVEIELWPARIGRVLGSFPLPWS